LLSRSAYPWLESRFQTTGQRLQRRLDLQHLRLHLITSPGSRIAALTVAFSRMPSDSFVAKLNEQIGNEFAAHQQYVAIAVHYDAETLPQLARFFYRQALEERDHAMMMAQYLLDADDRAVVPGVAAPQVDFGDVVAPVALALAQEKRVSEQINALAALARQENDYSSEQFMQWFIKEQTEEIATMSDLLRVVERSQDHPMDIEDYLAREQLGEAAVDPTAPQAAGAGG
jgi:ferritin